MSYNLFRRMKQELIDKYNVSVPRYTSYPPANFFRLFTGEEFLREVDYSNEVREKNLSFYFHSIFMKATHFQYFYIKFSIAIFIYFLKLFIY